MFYFNSLDISCKKPKGPDPVGEAVSFTLFSDYIEGAWGAELFVVDDTDGSRTFYPMTKSTDGVRDIFNVVFTPQKTGLYFYYFVLKQCGHDTVIGRNDIGDAVPAASDLRMWQLTVYDKDYKTPDWIKGGVFYHVFVDRFCKGENHPCKQDVVLHENWNDAPEWRPDQNGKILNNDFFGGDLKGIISKLEYLKSLGVTCIYLSPVFEAYSSHKYDTGDYTKIDPMFGSTKDFSSLCRAAKALGIRVICDGVFSHVGSDSVYFNKHGKYGSLGAYQSKESPYYKWFNFRSYPDSYDCWWNFETLPTVNKNDADYCSFINGEGGIIRRWIKNGASGWRLDVADELPDAFLEQLRHAAKSESPDALIIGEVWEDASNKTAYGKRRHYFQGQQLDSVMNYPLKDAVIDFVRNKNSYGLMLTMRELCDNYPACVLDCLMNILGTHDTVRIITALAGDVITSNDRVLKANTHMSAEQWEIGRHRLKIASLLQFTLPGVPCVYYGDEAGTEGYNDPFNRTPYPWGHEDSSLAKWYAFLGELRKTTPLLKSGDYRPLYYENGVFAFERYDESDSLIVCVNLSDNDFTLSLDTSFCDLCDNKTYSQSITIIPGNYRILKKQAAPR